MMSYLRNIHLQRLVSLFILLIALFSQIQTLYACDAMDGEVKQVCCCGDHSAINCPMADHCDSHQPSTELACCEISYDVANDAAIVSSSSTADHLTLLLIAPQPPPLVKFSQITLTPLSIQTRLRLVIDPPLLSSRGQPPYLLTRRLRL